jgi:hypothetical protein
VLAGKVMKEQVKQGNTGPTVMPNVGVRNAGFGEYGKFS